QYRRNEGHSLVHERGAHFGAQLRLPADDAAAWGVRDVAGDGHVPDNGGAVRGGRGDGVAGHAREGDQGAAVPHVALGGGAFRAEVRDRGYAVPVRGVHVVVHGAGG